MTYALTSQYIGCQPIANTETVQKHPLGTIVKGFDPTYGEAEFIYLVGVASTAVGSPVTYSTTAWTTTLAPVGTNIPQPIAVSMSANVASQYGWYQISGNAVALKSSASLDPGAAVGVATAGYLTATATGKEVFGAVVSATATGSATSVTVMINRPHMQGRVT